MDIRKVTYNGKTVAIEYRKPNGNDEEVVSFESDDEPRKAFKRALNNLTGDFLFMLELPDSEKAKTTLKGMSIAKRGTKEEIKLFASAPSMRARRR